MPPDVITVNHRVKCNKCRNSWSINVDEFKRKREDYGKGKPLLWSRLVCSKCRSRVFTISAIDLYPELTPAEREERDAYEAFEAKMDQWNSPTPAFSWDDYIEELVSRYVEGN